MRRGCCKNTGRTSHATATCTTFPPPASFAPTLFVQDSLASPSARTVGGRLKRMNGGYGPKRPVSFATFDPTSRCWKTSQGCLFGGLTTFSGTWPRAGMTRSGTAYRLLCSVPSIFVTACGLLPTPQARDHKGKSQRAAYGDEGCLPNVIGGVPHPAYVEALMGFPDGWTDLSASETPSSPKSQSGSDAD